MADRIKKRRLVEFDAADDGYKRMWGIGYARIAELTGLTESAVRKAVREGRVDPGDPLALADWIRQYDAIRGRLARERQRGDT